MGMHWFRRRGYRHFDRPVDEDFAKKITDPVNVRPHSFLPLIHSAKVTSRYKPDERKNEKKLRPIMYASHRDACIHAYYSSMIGEGLEKFYSEKNLGDVAIAYRRLGRTNYDFAAEVYRFAVDHSPCAVLCFDVSKFFENLDHRQLKDKLKRLLGVTELPEDWYRVFKSVTKYHYVDMEDLKANEIFKARLETRDREPIATIAELKAAGIAMRPNPKGNAGIPQGSAISTTLANLYMIDFDVALRDFVAAAGGLYRRYSDDILVICPIDRVEEFVAKVAVLLAAEKLAPNENKTEVTKFDASGMQEFGPRSAQYLGFQFYPGGPGIRPSSLSRQRRKMRRALKRLEYVKAQPDFNGKIYTKSLRKRFSPLQFRNFSSYARRSADAFGDDSKIKRQVLRLERAFEKALREIRSDRPAKE